MKSAVFNENNMIQGFLEHYFPREHQSFIIRVVPTLKHDGDERHHGFEKLVVVDQALFTWGIVGSARDEINGTQEVHLCDVLFVDKPELLGRIRGFTWFAEEFGVKQKSAGTACV